MTEAWGVVIAALVAVAGSFIGLYVGRRQVQDEAQVEHEQWLRGQRQEAYAALLSALDEAEKGMDHIAEIVVEQEEHFDASSVYDDESAWKDFKAALEPTRVALERLRLLGPEDVTAASAEVWDGLMARRGALMSLLRVPPVQHNEWPVHGAAMNRVDAAREKFLSLAQSVLGEAPTPAVRARRRRRQARLGA